MSSLHPSGFRSVQLHDFNSRDPNVWCDWNDLADPSRELPWIPPDASYVGRAILELARILGPQEAAGFRIMVSWCHSVEPILPHSGPDVIVFCLEDGFGKKPRYSHDVRLVAKSHGITRPPDLSIGGRPTPKNIIPIILQELRAQLIRLPAAVRSMARTAIRRRRATFVEIPLGTYLFSDVDFVPFESRLYDISFAGSTRNDGEEHRRILPRKTRTRREVIDQMEALSREGSKVRASLKTFGLFKEAKEHQHGYSEQMMQTRLAPCPRGGFRETYRLFEAAASGCVPITVKLPRRPYYESCPAIVVRSWSNLADLTTSLLADPVALKRRHEASLEWWRTWGSPEATAGRIARVLRGTSP